MGSLSERIMKYANDLPDAVPLCSLGLLQLVTKSAVDLALLWLALSGKLMRIRRTYTRRRWRPDSSSYAPSICTVLRNFSALWGETSAPMVSGYLRSTSRVPTCQRTNSGR